VAAAPPVAAPGAVWCATSARADAPQVAVDTTTRRQYVARVVKLHSEGRMLGEIDLSTCGSRHGFN
jgi:hypothetical protein